MPVRVRKKTLPSFPEVFARIWAGTDPMPISEANRLLKTRFNDEDDARISELLERNREGKLTSAETEELDQFLNVSQVMSILQAKARIAIKKAGKLKHAR